MTPDQLGMVFGALSDATRRDLLERLSRDDELSLNRLADGVPMTRQAVAKHLRVLEEADLVASTRTGRETRYRLRTAPIDEAAAWMTRVGSEWDARLGRLRRLVDG